MKTKKLLILDPNQNKMRKLFILITVLLCFVSVMAQNPFAEYGYKPKIATLSHGQYNEFFDNDTVVQIGSVLYNTKSRQIIAFVETDTLYSETTLQPDIVSRWISPDPLTMKFPNWSPYCYVMNNPIILIDPDGREPNRAQSGTLDMFFAQFSDKSKFNNVQSMYSHLKDNSTIVIRYVYTEKEGWMDMNHIFSVLQNGKLATDMLEPASGNPIIRELAFGGHGEKSFFSYEDLPSNRVGDEIGKGMKSENSTYYTGVALTEFITNALNEKGATTPNSSPNYSKIPFKEDRQAAKDKFGYGRPLTESELKSGKYVPQNFTDRPYNLKDFPAAPTSLENQ